MRRLLILTFSILLILSPLSSASGKAPKAGKSCKSLGKVITSKDREFTCIKRGKKRVWSKGVLIKISPIKSPTPSPTPNSSQTPTSTPTPSVTPNLMGYTRADVALRNTPLECWTIVEGNVYNLTSWISAHPGGPGVIRGLCGVDGTATFKAQHGKSTRPNSVLENYLLGPLKS